jgi:hypothetical protein
MKRIDRQIDVIIRFHNPEKLDDLSYCLLSLYGQAYPEVQPIIVLQGFTGTDRARVEEIVEEFDWAITGRRPFVHNIPTGVRGDHRSRLLNEGLGRSEGRYVAFLDYDDCVYQCAYEHLIGRLRTSGAAIAFGGIKRADVTPIGRSYFSLRKWAPYAGKSLLDFLVENCFPIHSFVIDRRRVDAELLKFDESMSKNEDYLFLLRIVSQHRSDLGGLTRIIGEHRVRTDGSNTISITTYPDPQKEAEWEEARRFIDSEKRRLRISLPVADVVALRQTQATATMSLRDDQSRREIEIMKTRINRMNQGYLALLASLQGNSLLAKSEARHFGYVEHWSRHGDVIHLWGWAADPERKQECRAVVVLLDGYVGQVIIPEIARHDVQEHLEIPHEILGFSTQFPLPDQALAYRTHAVLAVSRDGRIGRLLGVQDENPAQESDRAEPEVIDESQLAIA